MSGTGAEESVTDHAMDSIMYQTGFNFGSTVDGGRLSQHSESKSPKTALFGLRTNNNNKDANISLPEPAIPANESKSRNKMLTMNIT